MKNTLKSAFFFAAMIALTVGCQSKKTEATEEKTGTETVIESETLINGDSTMIVSDTATFVPDSTKK